MATSVLEGHYHQRIEIDHCAACHLIWFDETESVRLSGLGWATLLRAMRACPPRAQRALPAPLACPRCGAGCKPIRNLSRFGRTGGEECGYTQKSQGPDASKRRGPFKLNRLVRIRSRRSR